MLPRATIFNALDSARIYAEAFCYFARRSGRVKNSTHNIVGQIGHAVGFASVDNQKHGSRPAAFLHTVFDILGLRTNKKVVRICAKGVVAGMAHIQPRWHRPFMNLVREYVPAYFYFSAIREIGVAILPRPCPSPTACRMSHNASLILALQRTHFKILGVRKSVSANCAGSLFLLGQRTLHFRVKIGVAA